jgi:hypothetical protein
MERKADGPKIAPVSPGMMRCTLVGPKGMWIKEATKNAAVMTASLGISSLRVLRALQTVRPTLTA